MTLKVARRCCSLTNCFTINYCNECYTSLQSRASFSKDDKTHHRLVLEKEIDGEKSCLSQWPLIAPSFIVNDCVPMHRLQLQLQLQ